MSLLKRYDSFLLNNASQITAVESSLRSITYFLPGRFKDAELAGEAIYSGLNLLGLYHDGILLRALKHQNDASSTSAAAASSSASPSTLTLSEHARYTQHLSHSSSSYNVLARLLVIIGYLELLAEMTARRKLSKRRAWDVVAAIEATKALLRLALLNATHGRMTIQPPIPEREVDPAMLEQERAKKINSFAEHLDTSSASSSAPSGFWRGARTGFIRPTLASLRPGAMDATAATATSTATAAAPLPPPPPAALDRRPPHLRALQMGHNSGSDSDDTLVDSTRLNASQTLPLTDGTNTPAASTKHPSPAPLEPWTEKQINDYLLSRVLSVNDVRRPENLVRTLTDRTAQLAEVVWIIRPLLYVLALRKWGRKHKAPFAISLAVEYLARVLRTRATADSPSANPLMLALMGGGNPILGLAAAFLGSGGAKPRPISSVEQSEWARRDRSFWWYLLRGPAWHSWTRYVHYSHTRLFAFLPAHTLVCCAQPGPNSPPSCARRRARRLSAWSAASSETTCRSWTTITFTLRRNAIPCYTEQYLGGGKIPLVSCMHASGHWLGEGLDSDSRALRFLRSSMAVATHCAISTSRPWSWVKKSCCRSWAYVGRRVGSFSRQAATKSRAVSE